MDDSALFTKLLVARYSSKNGCHAQDGEVLIVRPKTPRPSKDTAHHFVSARDRRTKSKYGWAQEVAPLTLQDFITTHLADRKLSEDERDHIQSMLIATARIPVDKPATVDYAIRGVEHRAVVLNVHRVIFYDPKPENQQAQAADMPIAAWRTEILAVLCNVGTYSGARRSLLSARCIPARSGRSVTTVWV